MFNMLKTRKSASDEFLFGCSNIFGYLTICCSLVALVMFLQSSLIRMRATTRLFCVVAESVIVNLDTEE